MSPPPKHPMTRALQENGKGWEFFAVLRPFAGFSHGATVTALYISDGKSRSWWKYEFTSPMAVERSPSPFKTEEGKLALTGSLSCWPEWIDWEHGKEGLEFAVKALNSHFHQQVKLPL